MTVEILKKLFNRDINKLKSEINSYQNENKIWHIEKSISNSAGNLCLHLIGNLNTYIGAQIGNTNYIRNRELEFSDKICSKDCTPCPDRYYNKNDKQHTSSAF